MAEECISYMCVCVCVEGYFFMVLHCMQSMFWVLARNETVWRQKVVAECWNVKSRYMIRAWRSVRVHAAKEMVIDELWETPSWSNHSLYGINGIKGFKIVDENCQSDHGAAALQFCACVQTNWAKAARRYVWVSHLPVSAVSSPQAHSWCWKQRNAAWERTTEGPPSAVPLGN